MTRSSSGSSAPRVTARSRNGDRGRHTAPSRSGPIAAFLSFLLAVMSITILPALIVSGGGRGAFVLSYAGGLLFVLQALALRSLWQSIKSGTTDRFRWIVWLSFVGMLAAAMITVLGLLVDGGC